MADEEEDFYETKIRPNLAKLTSSLRVEIIQQHLQQEGLITDRDDQVLRLDMRTPIQRATYFLDQLKSWTDDDFRKFFIIIWESKANCPAHRKVAQLLNLSETSVSKPASKSQATARGIADPKDRDRIHSLSRKASYSMKAIPRGKAIIINNKCFFGRLGERKGTDEDATALVRLFQWLMFEVKRLNDQKSFEIQGALKKLADEDHSKYDCVIVAILSHGMDGGIYGTDDKAVSVEELTGYFKSSHSLAGKPKLFFLQACRGTTMDQGIAMDGLDAPDAEKFIQEVLAEDEADAKLASAIPSDADFLLSYATTPGFVSWRHQAKGSWYIQALVEVFERYACKEDLMSMLTMVNDKVAKDFQSMYGAQSVKQMPGPVTMLTKKLFFRPPE